MFKIFKNKMQSVSTFNTVTKELKGKTTNQIIE